MTGTYYVPPVKKINSPFGKSQMAKGKLVNQVKNILFRSGDTVKRSRKDSDGEHQVPEKKVNFNPGELISLKWSYHVDIPSVALADNPYHVLVLNKHRAILKLT